MSLSISDEAVAAKIGDIVFPTEKKQPDAKPEPVQETQQAADEPVDEQEIDEVDTGADDGDVDTSDEDASPEDTEHDVPAIDPPAGLTADEQELFRNSPPEVQKAWARREQDRQKELRRLQNEQAELRKQHDSALQQVTQERQQLAQAMQQFGDKLVLEFQEKFKDVTDPVALAQTDPLRFSEYQAYIAKFQQLTLARQAANQQAEQERQANLKKFRDEQNDELRNLIPHLKDDEKFAKFDDEISTFLQEAGFSPKQIIAASAKELHMAHDAMKWRKAQAARKAAEKKTPPPAVIKPGVKRDVDVAAEAAAKARNKLKKTGSLNDAAAVFRGLI